MRATATPCRRPTFDWMACIEGDIAGLKVAYSPDWGYAAVDPRVRAVVDEAVRVFERDLGCTVEEAHPGWDDPYPAFWGLVALESDLKGLRKMVETHGHEMTPHLVEFITRPWTAEELTDAVMARKAVNNRMWRFMRDYDLLLTPTLARCRRSRSHMQGPEKIDGRIVAPFQWLAFTFPINMTGPAGGLDPGRPSPTTACRWDCRSSAAHLDDPLGAAGLGLLRGGPSLGRPRPADPGRDGAGVGPRRPPRLSRGRRRKNTPPDAAGFRRSPSRTARRLGAALPRQPVAYCERSTL